MTTHAVSPRTPKIVLAKKRGRGISRSMTTVWCARYHQHLVEGKGENADQDDRRPCSEAEGLVQCNRVEVWVGRNKGALVRDGARLCNIVPLFDNFLVAERIPLGMRGRGMCHIQYTGKFKIEVFGPLQAKLG